MVGARVVGFGIAVAGVISETAPFPSPLQKGAAQEEEAGRTAGRR